MEQDGKAAVKMYLAHDSSNKLLINIIMIIIMLGSIIYSISKFIFGVPFSLDDLVYTFVPMGVLFATTRSSSNESACLENDFINMKKEVADRVEAAVRWHD